MRPTMSNAVHVCADSKGTCLAAIVTRVWENNHVSVVAFVEDEGSSPVTRYSKIPERSMPGATVDWTPSWHWPCGK